MREFWKKLLLCLLPLFLLAGCIHRPAPVPDPAPAPKPTAEPTPEPTAEPTPEPTATPTAEPAPDPEPGLSIREDEEYDTKDEVALYLYTYHHLPANYMTKKQARKKGWDSGALNRTIPGKCIGGDVYSNYEGLLPKIRGRTYYECDIDTLTKKNRGAKRIVWSNDWNIYYTDDHYDSFELLYGDDE